MSKKAKVAILRTSPATVLRDYQKLFELANIKQALDPKAVTILKDNISWHYPMPSANTTPWQLEGSVLGLHNAGYKDLVCVQNQTVVTNAFKGEDLNGYIPIFKQYDIEVRYNFEPKDMTWIPYRPKAEMLALNNVYPDGLLFPDFFFGKNIVHLPTVKCHMYTTTTGAIKNAFGGLLTKNRHYTHTWIHETIVALLAAAGGGSIALAYAAIMIVIFGVIGLAMDRVLPGKSTDLLIDLPPLRLPRPKNVLVKTYHKTVMFLREVILYFVAGALLLSVLEVTGALAGLQGILTPLTVGWLGLPAEASSAFVMGFVRRDFGATGLYELGLSPTQILVALVTITLFVPCIASVLIIMKERGRAFTAAVWLGSVGLAFLVGGIVARAAGVL